MATSPPPPHSITDEKAEAYANHLEFLWEQYNKLMGLGVLASAATLAFLLQGILFNKDAREVITSLQEPLNTKFLILAILFAGLSAIAFIISRWCSQILMERQVYGSHDNAMEYFRGTLAGETILPTALEPKWYCGGRIDRLRLLKITGKLNERAKFTGIILILSSWLFSFLFAWPLIEPLSKTPTKGLTAPVNTLTTPIKK